MADQALADEQKRRLDGLSKVLHTLLSGREPAAVALDAQPDDEIRQVAGFVNRVVAESATVAAIIGDLANGRLDAPVSSKSSPAQALKGFQATLRHLVWQTKQVAAGDYSQRVDFLGDFSAAFNAMVKRLDDKQKALERQLAELERLAATDPLTGLSNRRNFNLLAGQEIKRWKRYQQVFTILLFDLDHFKRVNDTFGHDVGDAVLETMARVCTDQLRESDFAARIGGEEFVVLFPATAEDRAVIPAERLRERIAGEVVHAGDQEVPFTMSGGLAQVCGDDESIDSMLKRADHALYRAKGDGRNRIYTDTTTPQERGDVQGRA